MRTVVQHVAVAAVVVVAVTAAVLVGDRQPSPDADPPGPVTAAADRDVVGLQAFDGCDELTEHVRDTLARSDATTDLPHLTGMAWGGRETLDDVAAMPLARGAADGDAQEAAAAPVPTSGSDVSATNVQEIGIDEPDIVETDGRRLLAVTHDQLHVVDVTAEMPRLTSSLSIGEGQHQLFLLGDRALVMSRTWDDHGHPEPLIGRGEAGLMPIQPSSPTTELTLLNLQETTAPVQEASATVDGDLVSARATDGTVRLVLRSWPHGIDLRAPTEPAATAAARRHNEAAIDAIDATQILPRMTVLDASGRTVRDAQAVDCAAVSRPAAPSGVGTTTVLTLRSGDGDLIPEDSTSVLADSQIVYASADRLYVATTAWQVRPLEDPATSEPAGPAGPTTEIHAFDTTGPASTGYIGSGAIDGQLLNQWALSERDGVLRVAVTRYGDPASAAPDLDDEPARRGPVEAPRSDSAIVTMGERAGQLVRLGEVGGLGPGERIYAVRYFDDLATVVTFRETDPLYTIGLSDPADPQILGELKIPGFSNYLHPVGGDHLLGVGQDADDQGRTRGVQVSLFDIADLAAPERTANLVLGQGHSEVQHDHHAFLWWPQDDLAVVPLEQWEPVDPAVDDAVRDQPWSGAVLVEVDRDAGTLREAARVTHADDGAAHAGIRRAAVVGDRLLTVSNAGVEATDLRTFETLGWAGF